MIYLAYFIYHLIHVLFCSVKIKTQGKYKSGILGFARLFNRRILVPVKIPIGYPPVQPCNKLKLKYQVSMITFFLPGWLQLFSDRIFRASQKNR